MWSANVGIMFGTSFGKALCPRDFRSQEHVQFLDEAPVALLQWHWVNLFLAPVSSEHQIGLIIIDGGHLVAENLNHGLLHARRHLFRVHIEQIAIFQHASRVTAKNEDVWAARRGNSAPLSYWKSVPPID